LYYYVEFFFLSSLRVGGKLKKIIVRAHSAKKFVGRRKNEKIGLPSQ